MATKPPTSKKEGDVQNPQKGDINPNPCKVVPHS